MHTFIHACTHACMSRPLYNNYVASLLAQRHTRQNNACMHIRVYIHKHTYTCIPGSPSKAFAKTVDSPLVKSYLPLLGCHTTYTYHQEADLTSGHIVINHGNGRIFFYKMQEVIYSVKKIRSRLLFPSWTLESMETHDLARYRVAWACTVVLLTPSSSFITCMKSRKICGFMTQYPSCAAGGHGMICNRLIRGGTEWEDEAIMGLYVVHEVPHIKVINRDYCVAYLNCPIPVRWSSFCQARNDGSLHGIQSNARYGQHHLRPCGNPWRCEDKKNMQGM